MSKAKTVCRNIFFNYSWKKIVLFKDKKKYKNCFHFFLSYFTGKSLREHTHTRTPIAMHSEMPSSCDDQTHPKSTHSVCKLGADAAQLKFVE